MRGRWSVIPALGLLLAGSGVCWAQAAATPGWTVCSPCRRPGVGSVPSTQWCAYTAGRDECAKRLRPHNRRMVGKNEVPLDQVRVDLLISLGIARGSRNCSQ